MASVRRRLRPIVISTGLAMMAIACWGAGGCAGELTDKEIEQFLQADGAGGGAGGGGGASIDLCAVPIMTVKCATVGCHGTPGAAGLTLTEAIVSQPAALADRPNQGEQGACAPAVAKLVDTQAPENSLMYTKVTMPTCGTKMPVIGSLTATESACILSWLRSIRPVAAAVEMGSAGGSAGDGG